MNAWDRFLSDLGAPSPSTYHVHSLLTYLTTYCAMKGKLYIGIRCRKYAAGFVFFPEEKAVQKRVGCAKSYELHRLQDCQIYIYRFISLPLQ
jgi:hypothetical protein